MIVPNRKYTYAELEKLRAEHPDLARVYARYGYVWRMDLDGTMEMVHWTKASNGGAGAPLPDREFVTTNPDPFNKADLPPIVKRTPQERMESLMAKVAPDIKAGKVLTLDELNRNRAGRPEARELTGEVVREAVQGFMEQAEAVNEETESKKIVRTSPTD
jgi:hypothetical protein